jgi:hypothetical protein
MTAANLQTDNVPGGSPDYDVIVLGGGAVIYETYLVR